LDLKKDGAIVIKEIKGRKKNTNKSVKRSPGNIRKKVSTRKQDYVKLTRKLRRYVQEMKNQGKISPEDVKEIRKKIRNSNFRSLSNMKEYIGQMNKIIASTSKLKSKRSKK